MCRKATAHAGQPRVIQTKVQTMKNSTQNFPVDSLLLNSADRFYPALSALVINLEGRSDARVAPPAATSSDTWWGRSYNQGLPAVGGRYVFLRGAWLPGNPGNGWNASASVGRLRAQHRGGLLKCLPPGAIRACSAV